MRKRLLSLGVYIIFWLSFFWFARLFFILTHHKESFQFGADLLTSTFFHGLKLDLSATGMFSYYLCWFHCLLSDKGHWFRYFTRWYTILLLFISSAIIVGDSVLYTYWDSGWTTRRSCTLNRRRQLR
jgi:hypothetical protein